MSLASSLTATNYSWCILFPLRGYRERVTWGDSWALCFLDLVYDSCIAGEFSVAFSSLSVLIENFQSLEPFGKHVLPWSSKNTGYLCHIKYFHGPPQTSHDMLHHKQFHNSDFGPDEDSVLEEWSGNTVLME